MFSWFLLVILDSTLQQVDKMALESVLQVNAGKSTTLLPGLVEAVSSMYTSVVASSFVFDGRLFFKVGINS